MSRHSPKEIERIKRVAAKMVIEPMKREAHSLQRAGSPSPEQRAMELPPGKTCDSCFAFRFCIGIGCTWSGRTSCDYFPNRYREMENMDSL